MANSFSFYIFPPSKANNSLNIFIYRIIWLLYQSNSDFPKQFIFAISIEHRIKQPVCKMQKQKRNSKLHIQHSSLPYSSRILLCPQCFSNFLLTFCILPTTETEKQGKCFTWHIFHEILCSRKRKPPVNLNYKALGDRRGGWGSGIRIRSKHRLNIRTAKLL